MKRVAQGGRAAKQTCRGQRRWPWAERRSALRHAEMFAKKTRNYELAMQTCRSALAALSTYQVLFGTPLVELDTRETERSDKFDNLLPLRRRKVRRVDFAAEEAAGGGGKGVRQPLQHKILVPLDIDLYGLRDR